MPGNGVLFSIGVSDGKTFDDLLSLTINPFNNASDRRWNDDQLADITANSRRST